MPQELNSNSHLHKLVYAKIGPLYVVSLKVEEPI